MVGPIGVMFANIVQVSISIQELTTHMVMLAISQLNWVYSGVAKNSDLPVNALEISMKTARKTGRQRHGSNKANSKDACNSMVLASHSSSLVNLKDVFNTHTVLLSPYGYQIHTRICLASSFVM